MLAGNDDAPSTRATTTVLAETPRVAGDDAARPVKRPGIIARRYGRHREIRYRRTWPQRVTLVICVALVAGCLYGAKFISDIKETFSDIPRIQVAPGVLSNVEDIHTDARNILVLGSTDVTGLGGGDEILDGRGGENLTDSMMILRIDPLTATAAVISIPRDLSFTGTKLNAYVALNNNNPEKLINVIKQYMNVDINDFVQVNFAGFRRIIDSIGGVPVYFPTAVRDLGSFFDAPAGCSILSGEQALNYVRARHFEELGADGRWHQDNKNDYGRAERQRDFLILAMDRAVSKGGRNPSTMRNLLKTAIDSKSMVLDDKLTPEDLLDIGRAFADFRPEYLQRYSLPTVSAGDESSNLKLDLPAADTILDVFRGNFPDVQPFQATVSVLDAGDPSGNASSQLADAGFRLATVRKAPSGPQPDTVIRFTSDERYAALLLGRYLDPLPAYEQIPGSKATLRRGETLTLIVGADFQGVRREWRGDSEVPLINQLIDASVDGKVSAQSLRALVPTTTAPAATVRGGSPTTTVSTTTTQPPTTAVTIGAGGGETSSVIGAPPSGVSCTRIDQPR